MFGTEHLDAKPWHLPELAKQRDALNTQINKLLGRRSTADAHRVSLANIDVRTAKSDHIFQADCPAQNRFELLQEELHLREALQSYFTAEAAAQRIAFDAAFVAHQEMQKTIRARLVEVGHIDSKEPVNGWIKPDFILTHPQVRAALATMENLRNYPEQLPQTNLELIDAVTKELTRLRQQALQ